MKVASRLISATFTGVLLFWIYVCKREARVTPAAGGLRAEMSRGHTLLSRYSLSGVGLRHRTSGEDKDKD